jgi:diguanylate cyclase (GGDEF)-like protein
MSQAGQSQAAAKPAKARMRVVVVEDSVTDAELLARHLAKAHLSVQIERVQTEEDFVAALRKGAPDLILSDFSLPRFDGLRALDLAVIHAPDTPFIYVSGTIGEERAIEALKRGATDYVLKSNLARLSSAIERALRESAMRSAKAKSDRRRQQQAVRLQRLTRTYRMLSSTGSAILRLRNPAELLDEVCRIGVHQGGYERVAISLLDPGTTTLRPRAFAISDSELSAAAQDLHLDDAAETQLGARAIESMEPALLNELADAEASQTLNTSLILRGYHALAALPLSIDGTAIGVMTLFSGQSGVFDQAELSLLLELTANLGFALQYHEKNEAVQFLSYFDSLTGLAKRPLFCQRLAEHLKTLGSDATGTVVVFDIQKLGAINDTLGRYVGDRLIENIASRLKNSVAETDRLAYFGGGTFALMLDQSAGGEDTGRWLRNAAAQAFVEPFHIEGQELRPTIRSGAAIYPHDADNADVLVQNAEAALKVARADNEKYVLYGFVTQRPTSRGLALEARLAGALERDEFRLHYQPKVEISTGRLKGVEALLRWHDSEDGLVPPSLFVPLLERSGAIVEVGEWVLLQAVRDIGHWTASGMQELRVAVNVSPSQLRRRDFVEQVLRAVAPTSGLKPKVDIEITESMLMQDLELSISKLKRLRAAGIGVAIDDFGTGYSSLKLLARLPVDTLKIDRSFVLDITDTVSAKTLVSTVVSLAHAFGMHTVAEGVESEAQLQMLRQVGCDQAQGYLLARPTPANELAAVISELRTTNG